jgi:lactoylglutathione lyase
LSEDRERFHAGPTTLSNIGVAMFTVADQDAALAFYTEKLGFEVRADTRFGEQGEMRGSR